MFSMISRLTGTEQKFLKDYCRKNDLKPDRALAALIAEIQNKPIKPVPRRGDSPRQKAIRQGFKWYVPATPCSRCGVTARRHVHDGRCSSCVSIAKAAAKKLTLTPSLLIREQYPEMVISRADAATLGFTIYRTGEPCKKGHRDYRYISTGNCIACKKLK